MKARRRSAPVRSTDSIERLVRSLVGVARADVRMTSDGRIDGMTVVAEEGASERQVRLNVTSALLAGLGITIDSMRVVVVPEADAPAAPVEEATPPAQETIVQPAVRSEGAENGRILPGPGMARGEARPAALARESSADVQQRVPAAVPVDGGPRPLRTAGRIVTVSPPRPVPLRSGKPLSHAGSAALATVEEAMPDAVMRPRLELVELWRVSDQLRCRVIVTVGSDRYVGIADAADLPGAAVELPARVTTDALRAARVPAAPIQLEGAGMADVGGRKHVVVSLQIWTGQEFARAAGAAAVDASIEEATARAVLQAANFGF